MSDLLYFASQNTHKLLEIRKLAPTLNIKPITDLGFDDELAETGSTLEENARQKARFIHSRFYVNCFAEDTGLEIDTLNGEPGVRSARYAGEGKTAQDNVALVLQRMANSPNRQARFRTVIALILDGQEQLFEGTLEGEITNHPAGEGGFGYDPIFKPMGSDITLAQMTTEAKNRISHRARAMERMLTSLGNKAV